MHEGGERVATTTREKRDDAGRDEALLVNFFLGPAPGPALTD
jgi:hypothetical protein